MTPLAMRIIKALTLPAIHHPHDKANIARRMGDIHCFEVSALEGVLDHDMIEAISEGKANIGKLAFLPAPATWIEHSRLQGDIGIQRLGFLLTASSNPTVANVSMVHLLETKEAGYEFMYTSADLAPLPLNGSENFGRALDNDDCEDGFHPKLYLTLAFINTPRLIDRIQHRPHRGLERSVRKIFGNRAFPVHPWSEIKLEIKLPKNSSEDGEPATRLTGGKALHFCRSHLRIRLGRLEIVSSHWRGDPALGVKLSRYKVAN